ncbi:uncharacterized protein LOC132639155 [Lycium barbarum]|uniref:uncharacterized protein LOC132639155 n=1 Tax=Lycium barbarum TaxID=112863 RepID=UPI00293E2ABF|nr:uncharacterized protein LOC132639155 [Lycium barbarum]
MSNECRFTLVGKFIKTRPQIEKLRARFAEKITVKGKATIGVYDYRTVFLNFSMEEDFKAVWYKRSIEIDEQVMWLEKWTPEFKPDEDSPIVPVWVLLPGLPFHLHTWNYVKQVVAPIGTPLTMDAATKNRTRPSMAKVRVEVNLTKTKLTSIFVGTEDENFPRKGFYQKIEYENVPKFCTHCRILGHSILQCRRVEKKKVEEVENKENRKLTQNNKVQVEESVDDDNVVETNQ